MKYDDIEIYNFFVWPGKRMQDLGSNFSKFSGGATPPPPPPLPLGLDHFVILNLSVW